jgi:hypothetical protein
MTIERTFDLHRVSDADSGRSFVRACTSALLGGFLLFAVVLGNLVLHGGPLLLAVFEMGIGFGFGALGLFFVVALGPGPTSLTIGPDSVTLHYGAARSQRRCLSSPGDTVQVQVFPDSYPECYRYMLKQIAPANNPLTSEAFDYLVAWARGRGMLVDDRPWRAYGATPRRIVKIRVSNSSGP